MSYILPNFLTPGPGTVTPAMMATQTAGSVLLWDASGNALAYAPGTLNHVLAANGAGTPPTYKTIDGPLAVVNAGTTAGRPGVEILLGSFALAAAANKQVTFAAGAYRKLRFISRTTGGFAAGNPAKLTMNNDVGANYEFIMAYTQGSGAQAANAAGGAAAGNLAVTASGGVVDLTLGVTIFPLAITGVGRSYFCDFSSRSSAFATAIAGTSNGQWTDTSTAMISFEVIYGAAATGVLDVWGVPA